ncbi:isoprenyl transferase [Martelella endophytica]|uniref:Isoprenyl transferase n=1 Tax=Martelella endophytica TaxID=1486262 RepID=A0A0D5LRC0_MAREN|nr:isoprenyl transferase [Martelella endophytica]AJY46676.1 UDP pyrophosphate synthase [Martelella endophytica]
MTRFPDSARPEHVAIIMDGNGRWAKGRGLRRILGHRKGVEAVRRTVDAAAESGIGYLTMFAFSSENWKRPEDEVNDIMDMIALFIQRELENYHRKNMRFRMIGERSGLGPKVLNALESAEVRTRDNTGLTVIVAVNYGARAEIARAAAALARDAAAGLIAPDEIDEAMLSGRLDTAGIPDPDLIIRTSGEQRLSNFLMWQGAYSELVFLPCLWPDFSRDIFFEALDEYARRSRRFGGLLEEPSVLTGS